jgi:hypothetical protein
MTVQAQTLSRRILLVRLLEAVIVRRHRLVAACWSWPLQRLEVSPVGPLADDASIVGAPLSLRPYDTAHAHKHLLDMVCDLSTIYEVNPETCELASASKGVGCRCLAGCGAQAQLARHSSQLAPDDGHVIRLQQLGKPHVRAIVGWRCLPPKPLSTSGPWAFRILE